MKSQTKLRIYLSLGLFVILGLIIAATPINQLILQGSANGNGQSFTNLGSVTVTGAVSAASLTINGASVTNVFNGAVSNLLANSGVLPEGSLTYGPTNDDGSAYLTIINNGKRYRVALTNSYAVTNLLALVNTVSNVAANAVTNGQNSLTFNGGALQYGSGTLVAPSFASTVQFFGNGAGISNIPPASVTNAAGFWSASPVAATNGALYGTTIYGDGNKTNWNVISPAGELFTNTAGGLVIIRNGSVTASGTFTGNGSGLTNLNVLISGIQNGGNIITNGQPVTTFGNGTFQTQLNFWDSYGDGYLSLIAISNNFAFNSSVSAISFTGNGSGLTNLPSQTNGLGSAAYTASTAYDSAGAATAATNTASLVRTNSTGVTLSGTFTGNGGGLTNLAYTNLVGAPVIPSTNGFVTAAVTNGLATTNIVNSAISTLQSNLIVPASITNSGLATKTNVFAAAQNIGVPLTMANGGLPKLGFDSWPSSGSAVSFSGVTNKMMQWTNCGMNLHGWTTCIIDDGWCMGHTNIGGNWYPLVNATRFPSAGEPGGGGFSPLVNFLTNSGLAFGLYTENGTNTSANYVGSFGYEISDVTYYSTNWGCKWLRFDGQPDTYEDSLVSYALKQLNSDIWFQSGTPTSPWPYPIYVFSGMVHSVKTNPYGDSISWPQCVSNILAQLQYGWQQRPGFLTEDMNTDFMQYTNQYQELALWGIEAMLSQSMQLGWVTEADTVVGYYKPYINSDLLAIDQDAKCIPATVALVTNGCMVFVKPLGQAGPLQDYEVGIWNTNTFNLTNFTFSLASVGIPYSVVTVRDSWVQATELYATNNVTVTPWNVQQDHYTGHDLTNLVSQSLSLLRISPGVRTPFAIGTNNLTVINWLDATNNQGSYGNMVGCNRDYFGYLRPFTTNYSHTVTGVALTNNFIEFQDWGSVTYFIGSQPTNFTCEVALTDGSSISGGESFWVYTNGVLAASNSVANPSGGTGTTNFFNLALAGVNTLTITATHTNGPGNASAMIINPQVVCGYETIPNAGEPGYVSYNYSISGSALPAQNLTGTLPQSTLPGAVVTNNSTALTLSGTFNGNSTGATNLLTNLTVSGPASISFVTNATGTVTPTMTVNGQTNSALTALSQNNGAGLTNLQAGSLTGTVPTNSIPAGAIITGTTNNDASLLGSENVGAAGWSYDASWSGSYSAGWQHQTNSATGLIWTNNLSSGKYQVTWTVTNRTNGTFSLVWFGQSAGAVLSASGAYGPTIPGGSTNLFITPTTNFDGTIAVSVKKITAGSQPMLTLFDSTSTDRFELRENNVIGNTFVGLNAGLYNTTGNYNTANGQSALYYNTTGSYNTVNGQSALYYNTTGSYNTANGVSALYYNTTGNQNTVNGQSALYYNTTGSYNTANGVSALYYNTTGNQNTANGQSASYSNTTGNYNTANGVSALANNTTGSYNTANGQSALRYLSDGSTSATNLNNVIALGDNVRALTNGESYSITIGSGAQSLGSSNTVIGTIQTSRTTIFGVVCATNGYFIPSNSVIASPIAGGGLLWNSNNALYWITSAHTNYVTGP